MARPCTAILIDPFTRTVTQVEWNGHYKQIAELIDCQLYDVARINRNGDGIFVDDEGLLKGEQNFFVFDGYPNPLAGKGLLLGTDAEGNSITPHITLDEARRRTTFGDLVETALGVAFLAA